MSGRFHNLGIPIVHALVMGGTIDGKNDESVEEWMRSEIRKLVS